MRIRLRLPLLTAVLVTSLTGSVLADPPKKPATNSHPAAAPARPAAGAQRPGAGTAGSRGAMGGGAIGGHAGAPNAAPVRVPGSHEFRAGGVTGGGTHAGEANHVPAVIHRNGAMGGGAHAPLEAHRSPAVIHRVGGSDARGIGGDHRVVGMRGGRIADRRFYGDVRHFHDLHSHARFDMRYAHDPRAFHGYWHDGWYHGYWHDYWGGVPWVTFSGHYGFWIGVGGVQTFVYESAPGTCMYWNGAGWVAWYNPPYAPYGCPY